MTQQEAIEARHSVRRYIHKPIPQDILDVIQSKIEECNRLGGLHIQLITNETKAFSGIMAYGQFHGVEHYLVMVGKKADDLDERVGYYGEQLVLLAQQLGLNSCWAGQSYRKVKGVYDVGEGEKIVCMIALGYGETQGNGHKVKTAKEVSNVSDATPAWFSDGVKSALLAPTAINQQKFFIEYIRRGDNEKAKVKAKKTFSLFGYTQLDLGIVKLHFEIGAGKKNFEWEE